jgi:hypothetical protein
MQLTSPVIGPLGVLITRRAGSLQAALPSTIDGQTLAGLGLLEQDTCMEDADRLVDVVLHLTDWTQVHLARELRRVARALHGTEPVGLDPVTVNRWKCGRQKPGPYYSEVLHHLYASVIRRSIESRFPGPPDSGRSAAGADQAEDVKRRQFLYYLTMLAASGTADTEWLGSALDARSRAASSLLDDLEATTTRYARQWYRAQPEALLPFVRGHLQALNELRGQSHPTAIARRLQGVTAQAAALVGWELWLTGDHAAAETHYALARELADDVGHDEVAAFVLVARSFIYSRLFGASGEMPDLPLRLLEEAVAVSARTRSPHLRTFALVRRAEERAATGGPYAAVRRDVDAALGALSGAHARHGGFYHYLDQERVMGTWGTCAGLLGDAAEAVRTLSQVIAAMTPSLAAERSILITDLAAAYAQMEEVEYACQLLGESLSLGHRRDANRIERIAGVRRTLLDRWAEEPSVRQLDEQLARHRLGAA